MANRFIIHGLSEEGKAYRAALEAIQKLHKPIYEDGDPVGCLRCDWESDGQFPCATRRLADQGLGDNLARTTKNGDAS